MAQSENIIPVDIIALVEDQQSGGPIVVLHDRMSNRLLPIWVGDPEARAIAIALDNIATPRPLTHKLLLQVMQGLDAKPSRIVIDRIKNHTYYASIYIDKGADKGQNHIVKIDARPSDAIAVALEARIPIFVEKQVMDNAAQENPFPNLTGQQPKGELKELKEEDVKKMKDLLDKARKREEQSGENK